MPARAADARTPKERGGHPSAERITGHRDGVRALGSGGKGGDADSGIVGESPSLREPPRPPLSPRVTVPTSGWGRGPWRLPAPAGGGRVWPPARTHLLHEVAEEDGLLPQGVVHQPVGEEDHALWKVVLAQPGHHPLLLHVRPPRDVQDQVAQILPVPADGRHRRSSPPAPQPPPHPPARSRPEQRRDPGEGQWSHTPWGGGLSPMSRDVSLDGPQAPLAHHQTGPRPRGLHVTRASPPSTGHLCLLGCPRRPSCSRERPPVQPATSRT